MRLSQADQDDLRDCGLQQSAIDSCDEDEREWLHLQIHLLKLLRGIERIKMPGELNITDEDILKEYRRICKKCAIGDLFNLIDEYPRPANHVLVANPSLYYPLRQQLLFLDKPFFESFLCLLAFGISLSDYVITDAIADKIKEGLNEHIQRAEQVGNVAKLDYLSDQIIFDYYTSICQQHD